MSPKKSFLRSRLDSFGPAFEGWAHVWATQPNAWIHSVISVVVILLGLWLRVRLQDWAALFLAMGLVWVAEFFNTALEAIVDLASPRQHRLAKIAKDVSAGAVVMAAVIATIVGLLVLLPLLMARLSL